MSLTSYTTYADIRAILGVTEEELTDSDLALENYLFELESLLLGVGANLISDYTAAASAVVEATETTVQKAMYRAVRQYASAEVSLSVGYSLPMRAQKAITDGKAGLSRFTDSPFRDTVQNLVALTNERKTELEKQYTLFLGGTPVTTRAMPSFMSVVAPAVDPVVG